MLHNLQLQYVIFIDNQIQYGLSYDTDHKYTCLPVLAMLLFVYFHEIFCDPPNSSIDDVLNLGLVLVRLYMYTTVYLVINI